MKSQHHRARAACVLAAALSVFVSWTAVAGTIFGPGTYASTDGKRQPFAESFTAVAETCASPAYTLVIAQGNPPVTSGSISLNGVEVVGENDFKKSVPSIEVPLSPRAGANALHIEVAGKPGSSISVAVLRELEQPVSAAKQYAITSGRLNVQDTLNADAAAAYAVVVRNGDASGHRVNGGSVRVGSATIDLSNGTVLARRRVALQATNSVAVDLHGPAGSFVTLQLMRVLEHCGPQIAITEPAEHATIATSRVVVGGTLVATPGAGVTVNDIPADVDWAHAGTAADPYRWLATISASPGPVTLTAVATDLSSSTARAVREVTFDPSPSRVGLRATPSAGVAPLDVTFTVDSTVDAVAVRYDLDLDGDGTFERTFDSYPSVSELMAHFAGPGVRTATLRVRTSDGQTFTATTNVSVQTLATMDAFLQQQWSSFTAALAVGDIEAALAFTSAHARERYRPLLELIRDRLPAYAAGISTIHPVWIHANAARYLMVRDESGTQAGYHVYFVRDAAGVWRIEQF